MSGSELVALLDLTNRPCAGFANCCVCPACEARVRAVRAHRAAGRDPYDADGKVKPPPVRRQPWQARRPLPVKHAA